MWLAAVSVLSLFAVSASQRFDLKGMPDKICLVEETGENGLKFGTVLGRDQSQDCEALKRAGWDCGDGNRYRFGLLFAQPLIEMFRARFGSCDEPAPTPAPGTDPASFLGQQPPVLPTSEVCVIAYTTAPLAELIGHAKTCQDGYLCKCRDGDCEYLYLQVRGAKPVADLSHIFRACPPPAVGPEANATAAPEAAPHSG